MKVSKLYALLSIFMVTLLLVQCKDDPIAPEEHFEAVGLYILSGADTLVVYQEGTVTGGITVGNQSDTGVLGVVFIAENGQGGVPAGDEYELDWLVADTGTAEIESADLDKWQFRILGRSVGNTTFVLSILHNGHDDFVSLPMSINVVP